MNLANLDEMHSWDQLRSRLESLFGEEPRVGLIKPDVLSKRLDKLRGGQNDLFAHMATSIQLASGIGEYDSRLRHRPVPPLRAATTFLDQFMIEVRVSGILTAQTEEPQRIEDRVFLSLLFWLESMSPDVFPDYHLGPPYFYWNRPSDFGDVGAILSLFLFGYVIRENSNPVAFSHAARYLRELLSQFPLDVSEDWASEAVREGGLAIARHRARRRT